MSNPKLTILPTQSDLVSAGTAAGANWAFKGGPSPMTGFIEQLVSVIVAHNISARSVMLDRDPVPVGRDDPKFTYTQIHEYDLWTGVLRAGWSGYKGRSNQQVATDGAKGVLCNVVGRYLDRAFIPGGLKDTGEA